MPSHSTTTRRLAYGFSLSSRIRGCLGFAVILVGLPPRRSVGMVRNLPTSCRSATEISADRYRFSAAPGLLPRRSPSPDRTERRRAGHEADAGRARPPLHLADLDPGERRAAAERLGQQRFRGDQLSRHYFARLTDDPDDLTDVPAVARGQLAEALLPRLLTAEQEVSCDQGQTRKTLWRASDGAYVESVLMRYPGRVTMC